MTVQYAIVAFPTFDVADQIEAVRRRFDPLSSVLAAHVTLVFPFEDSVGLSSLCAHVAAAAADASPFAIDLTGPAVVDGGYIFLHVGDGTRHLIDLHDRLYSGALMGQLSRTHEYRPHVTIGRLGSSEQLMAAAAEARATLTLPARGRIDSLALFRLEHGSHGSVDFTIPLGDSHTAG
jgi:2'-5' RNA ligase